MAVSKSAKPDKNSMNIQVSNPLLNNIPVKRNIMEVGFLIVLLAILLMLGVGFLLLNFGFPLVEEYILSLAEGI